MVLRGDPPNEDSSGIVPGVFFLNAGTVAHHESRDFASGPSTIDGPFVAGPDQAGQVATVVDVSMRQESRHPVLVADTKNAGFWAAHRTPAPETDRNPTGFAGYCFNQVLTAGDFPGCPQERDFHAGFVLYLASRMIHRNAGFAGRFCGFWRFFIQSGLVYVANLAQDVWWNG